MQNVWDTGCIIAAVQVERPSDQLDSSVTVFWPFAFFGLFMTMMVCAVALLLRTAKKYVRTWPRAWKEKQQYVLDISCCSVSPQSVSGSYPLAGGMCSPPAQRSGIALAE